MTEKVREGEVKMHESNTRQIWKSATAALWWYRKTLWILYPSLRAADFGEGTSEQNDPKSHADPVNGYHGKGERN